MGCLHTLGESRQRLLDLCLGQVFSGHSMKARKAFTREKGVVEMGRPLALSADEAKQRILFILDEGIVEPSAHCLYESMQQRGVSMTDIRHALMTGEIRRPPEWGDDHDNWKYRVEGEDTDGDDLTAITVIIEANLTLRIITVF
jgi:hypothetical protein